MCDFGRLVAIDKRPIAERRGFSALELPPPYYGVVLSVFTSSITCARVCVYKLLLWMNVPIGYTYYFVCWYALLSTTAFNIHWANLRSTWNTNEAWTRTDVLRGWSGRYLELRGKSSHVAVLNISYHFLVLVDGYAWWARALDDAYIGPAAAVVADAKKKKSDSVYLVPEACRLDDPTQGIFFVVVVVVGVCVWCLVVVVVVCVCVCVCGGVRS